MKPNPIPRLICVLLALAVWPACGAPEDQPSAPAAGAQVLGEYVLHLAPAERSAKLYRVVDPSRVSGAHVTTLPAGPSLSTLALVDAHLCADGTTGSNDPTLCGLAAGTPTVELATDAASVVDTFGTGAQGTCPVNAFCADVTLNSFWAGPINFTYAQVTAITDAGGVPLAGHAAINSDPAGRTGLSTSLGLWQYQSSSLLASHFAQGATGVMLPGASSGAKKTWKFNNPDDADTYIKLRVMAAQTYSNYAVAPLSATVLDACNTASGTAVTLTGSGFPLTQPAATNNVATFQLPFSFAFYGTPHALGATMTVARNGNIGPGAISANNTANNNSFPLPTAASSAPHPGIFPFWDALVWAPSGVRGLCARVYGATPNRQLAITWKRVGFTTTDATFMVFSTVLNEGSEEVWFQYPTMGGASPSGGATVGAQNEGGTVAATGWTSTQSTFGSGTSRSLIPSP